MNGHSRTLTVTALASLLLGVSAPALACSYVPTGLYESAATVPIDGLLVVTFGCPSATPCTVEDLPALQVRDTANPDVDVTGSIVRREMVQHTVSPSLRWALWRPDAPLIAGHEYTLQDVLEKSKPRTFTATEHDALDPASLHPSFSIRVVEEPSGQRVCCDSDEEPWESCSFDPQVCFYTERKQQVELSLSPSRLTPSLEQWVYRGSFRVGDQTTPIAEEPRPEFFAKSFKLAKEYCYTLDAVHVVTGEVVHLGAECKQLDVAKLITRPASRDELDDDLRQCASAPATFTEQWNQVRAADTASDLPALQSDGTTDLRDSGGADGCSVTGSAAAPQALTTLLVLLGLCVRRRLLR